MNPAERCTRVHHRAHLFHALRVLRIPEPHIRAEGTHIRYATFSTWLNSSSTGVDRPKIVTITFSVSRSSLTSSTTPVKLANGPSVMRTLSFLSNLTLSLGLSLDSPTRYTMFCTSSSESGVG